MFKVVIDTNLLISGSVDDFNYGNRIVEEVISGKIAAFANRQVVKENRAQVRAKIRDRAYRQKLEEFFRKLNFVSLPKVRISAVVDDPEDDKLLEAAGEAGADFLISGDKHLLKLGEYRGVRMVSPDQFWSIYEEEKGEGWNQWVRDFMK